ncbi:MAG: transposase [Verrucomicrobiales bacterium]|nr:transposase [Verrucomicrobiales bacterium]
MRALRLLGDGRSFYHCISRVVDRRKVFAPQDKEVFRKIMRNLERFMGVRVVTYCVMSNHFHLLVEVPDRETLAPLREDELLELLPLLHDAGTVETVEQELERARETGDGKWQAEIHDRYERRRGSLSYFLKELKQRVTLYMNKRLDRTGTFWEGRFKSILVEGRELSLLTVAAYIDLNPVRAGLVEKPEDYRWCGYAEALSGTRGAKLARRGLGIILSETLSDNELRADWRRTRNRYRQFLYEEGEAREEGVVSREEARTGFSPEAVEAVLETQGEMPMAAVLRHKVRYFCDGAALGRAEFVEAIFSRERERGKMGGIRIAGARKMRGADWGELRVLRNLRKGVIGDG